MIMDGALMEEIGRSSRGQDSFVESVNSIRRILYLIIRYDVHFLLFLITNNTYANMFSYLLYPLLVLHPTSSHHLIPSTRFHCHVPPVS